jgi:hypothetical protein
VTGYETGVVVWIVKLTSRLHLPCLVSGTISIENMECVNWQILLEKLMVLAVVTQVIAERGQ